MLNLEALSRPELLRLARARKELAFREETARLEASLIDFVEAAWQWIDPTEFKRCWANEGLCEHLQAVTEGDIRLLLINQPPRTGKTKITSICWPAWTLARSEQTFWSGNKVRFLCGSYGQKLSLENSNLTRRLIESPWYQERWGHRVQLRADQNTKEQFDLISGGSRVAASVGGSLLGLGYDVGILDDPHNTEGAESEAERDTTTNWFKEVRSTRRNDPKRSALVVNMQRLHVDDISGQIIEGDDYEDWTHYMVQMEYEGRHHCQTVLKYAADGEPLETWEDPRKYEGQLMWPEQFGPKEVADMKRNLGPYMASGRLQQAPVPAGGGIIKSDMWKSWTDENWPPLSYILGSLDTAYTEKEENDASALTIWGVFEEGQSFAPRAILLHAWEGRLELHALVTLVGALCSDTTLSGADYEKALALFNRGLVPAESLYRWPVDRLIIENKANGISVAQELGRLYGGKGAFSVELVDPKKWGDKVARLVAVEPMFADGLIYAPNLRFAQRVIDDVAKAPKTSAWDTVDSVSMGLRYLRVSGLLTMKEEHSRWVSEQMMHRPQERPLY